MTRGQHRDAFTIETPIGRRFEVALERFLAGQPFEFRDVGFLQDPEGVVVVIVDSSWASSNVTRETALADLDAARDTFSELIDGSPAFASAVTGRRVRYELIEDYGNGSVLLCSIVDGKLLWARGERPGEQNPAG